jgi:hypothetical protein
VRAGTRFGMTTSPQEPGETAPDRLDPEIPNPDVPVEPGGDLDGVPADPDIDPTAAHNQES